MRVVAAPAPTPTPHTNPRERHHDGHPHPHQTPRERVTTDSSDAQDTRSSRQSHGRRRRRRDDVQSARRQTPGAARQNNRAASPGPPPRRPVAAAACAGQASSARTSRVSEQAFGSFRAGVRESWWRVVLHHPPPHRRWRKCDEHDRARNNHVGGHTSTNTRPAAAPWRQARLQLLLQLQPRNRATLEGHASRSGLEINMWSHAVSLCQC